MLVRMKYMDGILAHLCQGIMTHLMGIGWLENIRPTIRSSLLLLGVDRRTRFRLFLLWIHYREITLWHAVSSCHWPTGRRPCGREVGPRTSSKVCSRTKDIWTRSFSFGCCIEIGLEPTLYPCWPGSKNFLTYKRRIKDIIPLINVDLEQM